MGGWGLSEKLDTLPVRPGVYLFKDGEGHVLYVGKARVLRDRVRSYFQAGRPVDHQRGDLVGQIADLDLVVTDTEMEALALENNFIKRHQPRYNILLRDDKNHPYLKLTLDEEYPRIYVVRRGGRGRERLRRTLHPGQAGPPHGLDGAPHLRHPLLQGDAQRPAAAALPAVPDQALPGPLRGRDLLPRPLPPGGPGRAPVPGRAHRRGREEPARADGGGGPGVALRGGGHAARPHPRPGPPGGAAEDHHHRHRRARPLRRPRRMGAGRPAGLLRARGQGGRARGLSRPSRGGAGAVPGLRHPAVLRGRPALRAARGAGAGGDPGPRAARGVAQRAARDRRCGSASPSAARRCGCWSW